MWPAQSPGFQFNTDNGGTEFFLSSIVVWTLTHTSSLDSATPSLSLTTRIVNVNTYAIPPGAKQPGSGTAPTVSAPQGFCINNTTTATIAGTGCWRLLSAGEPAHDEVIARPDWNDTRAGSP